MTLEHIVVELSIEIMTVEGKITMLQNDLQRMETYLNSAQHLKVGDGVTREERDDYITDLRNHQAFYRDILKAITDVYYDGTRGYKGGRHNVDKEEVKGDFKDS